MRNCNIQGIVNKFGAGLLDVYGKGQVIVENSHFERIHSFEGGVFRFNNEIIVKILSSDFLQNTAQLVGGAISAQNDVFITIYNCTFERNNATYGGAISFNQAIDYHITDSLFYRNNASYQGSALFIASL